MLGKKNKILLKNHKGFTLVELMTVLIILGVILGIGLPKYLQIQAKAEWEADETTIRNFAKAAEAYAASINSYKKVKLQKLIDNALIDGNIKLNRVNGKRIGKEDEKSYKNGGTTLKAVSDIAGDSNCPDFEFNTACGNVRNLKSVVKYFIGDPPYGAWPEYPLDSDIDEGLLTP